MVGTRRLDELTKLVRDQATQLPDGPTLVALSGGADSAIACWLMTEQDAACRAVHVDHGLPGSGPMRVAAEAVAARLGIECEVREIQIPKGASPEGQARVARYAALEESLAEDECLVTGHTRDDQAETVLLNVLRGAGLEGLAGIPARRGRVARPILAVRRSETRELATLLGLPWRDDPANEDPDPRRNQVRREVLPLLEERFNPKLRESLVALAQRVAGELEGLRRPVQTREISGGLAVCAPELHSIGPRAASHALRDAIRRVRGPHGGTAAEVDRLLAVAAGGARATELSGGIQAYRRGPWLVVEKQDPHAVPAAIPWRMPGSVRFGAWLLESWHADRPPVAYPLAGWTAVADADLFPPEAVVRPATRADAVDGVDVYETLRRLGAAAERRSSWPVVEVAGTVLWVPGARISRSVWVGSTTRRYLWVHTAMETV